MCDVVLYIVADIDVDIGNKGPMGIPTRVVVPSCFQGRDDSYHIQHHYQMRPRPLSSKSG